MTRTYAQQKSALTRALKTGDAGKVEAECLRALDEWSSQGWRERHGCNAWPDDWHRWNRALDDVRSRHTMDTLAYGGAR